MVIRLPTPLRGSTVRKIRTFLSSRASLSRDKDLGEIEYLRWPILLGSEVSINGKPHQVIGVPAFDPLVRMPRVLYNGQPMSDDPEPAVLVEESPSHTAGQF
jgi:hypothetical protein